MAYTTSQIFENPQVNIILDSLHTEISGALGINSYDFLFLTGRAAAYLQEESSAVPEQVVLITTDPRSYGFLIDSFKSYAANIQCKGNVFFQNRLLFYFDEFYLEVWLSDTPITSIFIENINAQVYSEIPEILL